VNVNQTQKASPFFSVVLATYNRGKHIRPTIESVLRQRFSDFELLVVGDGCDDATERVVRSYADEKVSWRNLPRNSGSQSAPNNEGIGHARGDWIAYIGHDDVWAPDHLQALRDAVVADPATDFAVSGCIYYGPPDSGVYYVTGLFETSAAAFRHFLPPTGLAHRRDVSERVGIWREPALIAAPADADFVLRAAHAGLHFKSTGRVTAHKFAAGHRYLSYLRPSSVEQTALLRSFAQGEPDGQDHIIDAAKREGRFMIMRHPSFSTYSAGYLHEHNRQNKGLSRPALRPIAGRTILEQTDDARALDWYPRDLPGLRFRWSGPNPRPKILIPFTGSATRIAFEVAHVAEDLRLDDVSVFVEDRRVGSTVERAAGSSSLIVVQAELNPAAYTIITLHTPKMFRPSEIPGRGDTRSLGIAVADIVVEPV
jgi:glycosyltransferase involved in cell wall biosynthesis